MTPLLTLAQHPMYLLIKEDTLCAERTPPWGAPDIETYIERLRQNIATLEKYPQVKIGYEWSGLELEQLAADAPDVFRSMLDLVKRGQCAFYNGTYSQPHLQTLSSESNFRQFEWGARVYRELCDGHQVRVYAHQESSLNDQTPQLLAAFGIRFGAMPYFICTMEFLDRAEFLYHGRFGAMLQQGAEFAAWRGLDGTEIDLYIQEPLRLWIRDWLDFQEMLGLFRVPPVMVDIPDLIDVGEHWISERSKARFCLLDDALPERRAVSPPRSRTRVYSNWSYIEGIRAEELSRSNYRAEHAALRAEALGCLGYALLGRAAASTDPAWKKILTTQHHDVYCFCAPELRDKSVRWLGEAEAEASRLAQETAAAIAEKVDTESAPGEPLIVFATTPHPGRIVITAPVDAPDPVVCAPDGTPLPTDVERQKDGQTSVRFLADLEGLGYRTFTVRAGRPAAAAALESVVTEPYVFANPHYQATVKPDGTFTSLRVLPSDDEVLEGSANPGNLLLAMDSTGLGPRHEGALPMGSWEKWTPPGRGPDRVWQPGAASVRRSALGAVLAVRGMLGADAEAALCIRFYHALPRIDIDWTFDFHDASLGTFYDDDTKLRVQWPLAFSGRITHDIAFGVVEARDGRAILPASWVDISDGRKGLAYLHTGTPKHWVRGQTLFNLFAWGEDTDAIGNRLDMTRWGKTFDQRLRGTHVIRAALCPHSGDWRAAGLSAVARNFTVPALTCSTTQHSGPLPAGMEVLRVDHPELVATAVKMQGDTALCRLYSLADQSLAVEASSTRFRHMSLASLQGEPLDRIAPFQIAHLECRKS